MSRKFIFCVAACFILTSVYAARRSLNSITDLIDCHLSEHTNILELLHWFAHEVDIDHHIRLTFDPASDYGSHHYGNFEDMLDQLPWGYQYYTIGNLYEDDSDSLPSYVRNPHRRNIDDNNKARIIIRVEEGHSGPRPGQIIDQVYITQHFDTSDEGTNYDPDHTYRITPSLLHAIRRRNITEIQQLARRSYRENASARPQGHPTSYSQQARYKPSAKNNDDFLMKFCFAIFVIIIFALFACLQNNFK
ncbi:uncharacterized protein LOC106699847 [Xiphophorus maculatus]|uniref:uncharacterized protein LOC106699847 n=1 Tax=Xiphophorus maculatus TaxID=8083 RepID=UPI0006D90C51|nr:uncharacterized protein LOC106699847 [Xiphophorus maculatus]